ncbi:HlyD family type I secretion periplasmic adaptor subunit [Methylobacterium aerolatum]|uniref:Membrane fusion protein (MFP) family protein n=1 Tax=Methylobacterium aerolatum TaxID=418708 RepID=A0ABU0I2J5_9HYPH|nr:HlyD family type I secretion periplasmic adaptor subunit [Methylobacterium aerolatum]MDQ0448818.1 HlyD family secretion protein [Methylobacterium aerolatum]GJD34087.1 Hemolysin secretion protein D, chromosomal [Methylobacterium aerolatum]
MRPDADPERTLRRFASETDEIREAPEPLTARLILLTLTAFLVTCLGLTAMAQVDRVVTSERGKIVSTQAVMVFQALDASIIKTIDVREGDQVRRGQLLATLDPTFANADAAQLKQQVASLDAQIARAEAEQEQRALQFGPTRDPDQRRYNDLQRALYEQRVAQFKAQLSSFDEKIQQSTATIQKLQGDEARLEEREKIAHQIEMMRQQLVDRQAGSLLNLLLATDQRLELLRTLENGRNGLVEARHQLASTIADRDAFRRQWQSALSQEIVAARNARDTAMGQRRKADRREELIRLEAAEDGVVLNMAKLSVGSVLREGDQLLSLMPLSAPLEAEIHVAARNIGFIRAGDPATLKVDAFNFIEHGTAEGHLRWISEGAFTTDDDGKPVEAYYKARVSVEKVNFVRVPASFRLIPGMTLTADVHIGTRSVMAYVVGGALRGAGEAMREP